MAGQAVFTLLLLLGELSADTGIVLRGGKGLRRWLLCSVPPRCGLSWGSLLPPAPWGYTVLGEGGVCGRYSPGKPSFGGVLAKVSPAFPGVSE